MPRTKKLVFLLHFGFAIVFFVVEILCKINTNNSLKTPILLLQEVKLRHAIVKKAIAYLGTPYRFGGNDKSFGFDCSGFTQAVYRSMGYYLPHGAQAQYQLLSKTNNPKEGDLVFFGREHLAIGHVGILVSQNLFIHAPSRGKQVRFERMDNSYYKRNYVGAASIFR